MKNRLVKVLGSHGFTLIELVVSLSIMIVVVAASASVLTGSMKGFNKTGDISAAATIGNGVFEWYKDQLTYATDIDVEPTNAVPSGDRVFLKIDNGNLMVIESGNESSKGWNVFGEGFYGNMKVETSVMIKSKTEIWIAVAVKNAKGQVVYSTDSVFKCLNLELAVENNTSDRGITHKGGLPAQYGVEIPGSVTISYTKAK